MRTFNEQKKKEVLEIAKKHREADRFIQGRWIRGNKDKDGMQRGCFFGCMVQTNRDTLNTAAKELEIPHWIVYVSERIFEGLPKNEAVEFPVQLIQAIKPNEDTFDKYKKWHYTLLMDSEKGQINFTEKESEQYIAIKICADLFLMETINISAARSSAMSAAGLARSAARSVMLATESVVMSAEWSARSVEWLVESAAMSAAESAMSAARSAHYQWMRDTLIKILSE